MEPYEILARLAEHGTPPDGDVVLKMSVGLEDTLQRFEDEILSFISGGGAELRFFYGPYGRGKSHLLKSLQALAKHRGFVTAYIDCRAEQSPFATMEDTYRMIVSCMEPPDGSNGVGIEAVIRTGLNNFEDEESISSRLRKEQRLELGLRNLVSAYIQTLFNDDRNQYLKELAILLNAGDHDLTMQDLYRRYPQAPRPLGKLSRRNAGLWVRSLAAIPSALNYPGFLILFDETEKSHHMADWRTRKRHQHLVNIRNLVDHVATGNFSGCAFCFAVVEEFMEIAGSSLEALAQRIERINHEDFNPRAVWASLDELTSPAPSNERFFQELGARVVDVAVDAGMDMSQVDILKEEFQRLGQKAISDISSGAVREFVKSAAAGAAQLIDTAKGARHV